MSDPILPGLVSTQIVTVTPDIARQWLARNTRNRRVAPGAVQKYARDMAEGRWQFAADPIRFDIDGNMIDGQHRTHAVAQQPAGFSVQMLVVTGLPRESQSVMDQGKKRSGTDQLGLAGIKNASNISAAARWMIILDEGILFRDTNIQHAATSVPAIEQWVSEHPSEVAVMQELCTLARSTEAAPSVALAMAAQFARVAPVETVRRFYELLAHGGAPAGSPINVLDQKLRGFRRNHTRVRDRDLMAIFIRTWNAWITGKTTRLSRPEGSVYTAKNFPTIKAVV